MYYRSLVSSLNVYKLRGCMRSANGSFHPARFPWEIHTQAPTYLPSHHLYIHIGSDNSRIASKQASSSIAVYARARSSRLVICCFRTVAFPMPLPATRQQRSLVLPKAVSFFFFHSSDMSHCWPDREVVTLDLWTSRRLHKFLYFSAVRSKHNSQRTMGIFISSTSVLSPVSPRYTI